MTQSCEQETKANSSKNSNRAGQQQQQQQRRTMASSSQQQQQQQQQQRLQRRQQQQQQNDVSAYVPAYLKRLIYPYHGEYCYTPIFKPHFIAQLMAEGFLPVATKGMLLPKLHKERSVIPLPHGLHVSKSVRKKSKRFSISINTRFDQVIQGCHAQHGSHCWLYPPLVAAFRAMMEAGDDGMHAFCIDDATGRPVPGRREWPVRLYTVEVWNEATGELAGGELGYTVGSIYTSLTGFTKEDSAGSVQLAALGRLLSERGFELWDMGMHMEYKSSIGAELMPREVFLSHVHRVRDTQGHLVLPRGQPAQNCKQVIDRNNPNIPPMAVAAAAETTEEKNAAKAQKGGLKPPPKGIGDESSKDVDSSSKSLPLNEQQTHTPPQSEADAPIKKRARKPGVD